MIVIGTTICSTICVITMNFAGHVRLIQPRANHLIREVFVAIHIIVSRTGLFVDSHRKVYSTHYIQTSLVNGTVIPNHLHTVVYHLVTCCSFVQHSMVHTGKFYRSISLDDQCLGTIWSDNTPCAYQVFGIIVLDKVVITIIITSDK